MTTTLLTLGDRLKKAIGDEDGKHSSKYTDAINAAARESYPTLFRYLRDLTLVTGNALPNSSFEDWAVTTIPDFHTASTGGCAENTTAAYVRGQRGSSSCKVTASGADDGMVLDSLNYPRLLDLMNTTVTLKCGAYPSAVNDAFLDIITTDSDGADTTESSTTACPVSVFTLLKIEDYAVPDAITRLRVKFRVHSTTENVYFDSARVTGKNVYDYLLPTDFRNGALCSVGLQSSGYSDDICDDLNLKGNFSPVWGWDTYNDGTYKYLHTDKLLTSNRTLELVGYCPLENDLDADAETMSIDEGYVDLLISKAAYCLYRRLRGIPATGDIGRFDYEMRMWDDDYNRKKGSLGMIKPSVQMNVRGL